MKNLVLESIKLLPEQYYQAWKETNEIKFSKDYRRTENIVIAGMGGSAYSYYVLRSLFSKRLGIPFVLANDYHLPGFVNKSTLVIASSYSGNTEETISCAQEAIKRGARLTAITSGGQLGQLMKKNRLPYFLFEPKYNPSGQPRMGQGYIIGGAIFLLSQLGKLALFKKDFTQQLKTLKTYQPKIREEAKKLVNKLKNKIIVFVAAEHLGGNAHILRNQTNETSKNFAAYSLIPELNHHLMEGLENPQNKNLVFLFLDSKIYFKRIKKRIELTKEVIEKNKIRVVQYLAQSGKPFLEMVEVLILGGYLTYFLAKEYKVNPQKIPWVDYFKKKLAT